MADDINTDNFKFVEDAEEKEIMIWNAAIEDVAKLLDEMGEEARISEYVREMKK